MIGGDKDGRKEEEGVNYAETNTACEKETGGGYIERV
jgi:hypothetical protein